MSERDVELRLFTGADGDAELVQQVLESQPVYAQLETGGPVGPQGGRDFLLDRPEGIADDDKLPFGVWRDGRLVGLLDVIRHWPRRGTLMIGLLLVEGSVARTGVGSAAFAALLDLARTWPDADRLRIAVLTSNTEVMPFWDSLGFAPTGDIKHYSHGSVETEVAIYERPL